ncbi:MAG: hypothetical protein FWE82_06570 [Defluviitaleaceae bacterium]|nr:hypothetical protein [Defluviitaleaceae bacterium]
MVHVLNAIPVTATLAQALDALRVTEPEDVAFAADLFKKSCDIARPKALYREVFVEDTDGGRVEISGVIFNSRVLAAALSKAHRLFAYVCTCGIEVDDWSHKEPDPVAAVWIDMFKQMFVVDAAMYLRNHLTQTYGFTNISSINPGSGDIENWPISQQSELFLLIGGVKEQIGVTLTDSYLMIPTKSTSGLYFPSETEFVNCALCSREVCENRRAPYDMELHAQALGGKK